MASTTGSDEAGAAGISEAPAASSSGAPDNSAAPAPALETSAAAATELQAQPPQQAEGERPSSPAPAPDPSINLQAVLRRPFKDVLAEFISSLQLKSSAATAAEQLRYLLHQSDCNHTDVLASPVMPLLVHMIKESPGMPGSASAMKALAILALSPDGRAMLRLEGALHPVTKYLAIPGLPQKHNAGPALQLLQNACCDKLNRHVIAKASGLEVLLDLIKQAPTGWLRQHPQVAAPLAGALTNLLVSDMEGSTLKHRFVKAGGIEATCRALAEFGRMDTSPPTQRLRLLLNDVSHSPQYTIRVQETALDASTLSARLQGAPMGQGMSSHPNSNMQTRPEIPAGVQPVASAASVAL